MADFSLWDRATLEQFAREATEKMVADKLAIDELVGALGSLCDAYESALPDHVNADWFDVYNNAHAVITKHTQRKEQ